MWAAILCPVYYLPEDSETITESLPHSFNGGPNTAISIGHGIIILQIKKKWYFFYKNIKIASLEPKIEATSVS